MKPFSTLDLETDPFLKGRIPQAFAAGFYDGKVTTIYPGPACCIDAVNAAFKFPGYVYLHNGGKFDLHFLLPAIIARFKKDTDLVTPLCIGARMVEIKTPLCTFRDSYALIPKPLKTFGNKKDIEIWKLEKSVLHNGNLCLFSKETDFEERRKKAPKGSSYLRSHDAKENLRTFAQDIFNRTGIDLRGKDASEFDNPYPSPREFYRDEIHGYLKQDCVGLYDGLKTFFDEYGCALTLASTTFKVLKKQFGFKQVKTNVHYDDKFRGYYFAGRVQFFGLGKFPVSKSRLFHGKCNYRIYDINSAFPWAMLKKHWHGDSFAVGISLPKTDFEQCFFDVTADSRGALAFRNAKTKAVEFPVTNGQPLRFRTTGWELKAGLDLGLVEIKEIHGVYRPETCCDFSEYVNHFYKQKSDADKEIAHLKASKETHEHDAFESLMGKAQAARDFAKLFLNSAYGKFALNPREFRDVRITGREEKLPAPWERSYDHESNGLTFWQKETYGPHSKKKMPFYNVATAASITGCVRAYLQRAMAACGGVLYCDTDSLIVADAHGLSVGPELGQWKLEKECSDVWIGGKKLYAALGTDGKWKKACKGVRLSVEDIVEVCEGQNKSYSFDAPNFSVYSKQNFTTRTIRRDDQRIKR